jgi:capsule biosynthesis phosphatase
LGVRYLEDTGESVVFLDNDVLYNFPPSFFDENDTAFVGYSKDKSHSDAYSFLTLSGDYVTYFKEKKRISDNFCCGVYGFQSLTQFCDSAYHFLMQPSQNECYMSALFELLLEESVPIRGIYFEGDIHHIGSLPELQKCWNLIEKKRMTVCFDLDNTLVTYPTVPGDYTTVKPIERMVTLARKLKAEGHEIIIHTARRMATHKNDVDAVIRDVGELTEKTLKDVGIPYDRLLFGKPLADAYIDDRAVNPYRNSISIQGYIGHEEQEIPINMIPTNKYNTIEIQRNRIIKRGPAEIISGESFYYESIPKEFPLRRYFPEYYGTVKGVTQWTLSLENIPSIPLYKLFSNELMTEYHVQQLFEFMDTLHTATGPVPENEDMIANYSSKLEQRFTVLTDYPFEDALTVQTQCIQALKECEKPQGVGFIHGDLWFSNILVDFKNNLKMIDMKGRVNGIYTTGGDRRYDYCKLYQSFLGYDAVLYGETIPETYRSRMEALYVGELTKRQINMADIKRITFSLIVGTFPFIKDIDVKFRVWNWIKHTVKNLNTTVKNIITPPPSEGAN